MPIGVRLVRTGRNLLAAVIGTLFPMEKVNPEKIRQELADASRPRKLLIVRPNQGLGDLLIATPLLRTLQERLPHIERHMLIESYLRPAIESNPRLTRLWIWDKKAMRSLHALWAFIKALRAERFDAAIILSSHVPSFTGFLMARAMSAKRLIAFHTQPFYGGANWSRWLTSHEIPVPPEQQPEGEKFAALVEWLTGPIVDRAPEFEVPAAAQTEIAARWTQDFGAESRPWIGLFMGGNPDRPERLWPVEEWVKLIQLIEADGRYAVVAVIPPENFISGSRAKEAGILEAVTAGLGHGLPTFSDSRFTHVAAFLQRLALWICPDGGLFHVALGAQVPTLGLFLVTDPARWYFPVAWGDVVTPPSGPRTLTADRVWKRAQGRLLLKSPAC